MREILENLHGSSDDFYYLDRHMYKVGNLLIKSNQKCSCRTIRDILVFLDNKYGSEKFSKKLHILTFRNIYKRLVSGYLDIYVFDDEYRKLVKDKISVETFYDFVTELSTNGVKNFDKFHFNLQTVKFNKLQYYYNFDLDYIFDSEKIDELVNFIIEFYDLPEEDKQEINNSFNHSKENIDKNYIIRHQNTTENIGDIIPYATGRDKIIELRKNGTYIKYDLYYNNKIRSIVKELYYLDTEYLKDNSKKIYSDSLKNLLE